jgi:hypothetical protein
MEWFCFPSCDLLYSGNFSAGGPDLAHYQLSDRIPAPACLRAAAHNEIFSPNRRCDGAPGSRCSLALTWDLEAPADDAPLNLGFNECPTQARCWLEWASSANLDFSNQKTPNYQIRKLLNDRAVWPRVDALSTLGTRSSATQAKSQSLQRRQKLAPHFSAG